MSLLFTFFFLHIMLEYPNYYKFRVKILHIWKKYDSIVLLFIL